MVESVQNHNLLKSESITDKTSKRGKRGSYKKHQKIQPSSASAQGGSEPIDFSGMLTTPTNFCKKRVGGTFADGRSQISGQCDQNYDDLVKLKCEESGCERIFKSKKSLRNHV